MRFIAWLVLLAVAFPVTAQTSTVVEPGARVRVWAEGRPTIGTLDRVESGRLHLQGHGERSWDLDEVERIDVSTGRQRHALPGAFIGLIAGFAFAHVAARAVDDGGSSGLMASGADTEKTLLAAFGVWSGSVVAGALIGHAVKTDRWTRGSVHPTAGMSGPNSASVGVAFRF